MIDAHRVRLSAPDDFEGWRDAARNLAEAGVPAEAVVWEVEGGEPDLFGSESSAIPTVNASAFSTPCCCA